MEDKKKGSTSNRRSDRVSADQLDYLFNYMSQNVQLRDGKLSPTYTLIDRRREWDRLAATLNSLGGAVKNRLQWIKTWNDKKGYVRHKAARIQKDRVQTGKGREGSVEALSQMEEALLSMTGWVAATGDTSVPEAGIPTSDSIEYSYTDSVNPLFSCIDEIVIESGEHSYLKVLPGPSATITGPSATITGPSATITRPSATITGPSATVTGPATADDDPSVSAVKDDEIASTSATATGPSKPPNQGAKRSTLTKRTEMALKELKLHSNSMERNSVAVEKMAIDIAEMNQSIKSIANSIEKLTDYIINKKD